VLVPSLVLFAFGLCIGSFLNVLIYRLPKSQSIVSPGSRCPTCGTPIHGYDNIPLISYALLAGTCRHCRAPISVRYPLVEGLTGALFALSYAQVNPARFYSSYTGVLVLIHHLTFVSFLIPILFIDLDHQIIPNELSYPLLAGGVVFGLLLRAPFPVLLGAGMGAGLFLLIVGLSWLFLRQMGMGMGDVKLAAAMGAFLGWKLALLAFFVSFLLGAVIAAVLLALKLRGRRDRIPFGPFLVAAGLISLFLGNRLIQFYLGLFW